MPDHSPTTYNKHFLSSMLATEQLQQYDLDVEPNISGDFSSILCDTVHIDEYYYYGENQNYQNPSVAYGKLKFSSGLEWDRAHYQM